MHEPWYKDWNSAASPLSERIAGGLASSVTLYAEPTEDEDGLATVSLASKREVEPVLDALPESLKAFLTDLRLLRHVPLAYLLPDPALLPPESIRFFHVNPTWVDRLIDGTLAAANLGTLEMAFSMNMMWSIRQLLDERLTGLANDAWQLLKQDADSSYDWDGAMTGLLLRSELVERWPKLEVLAWRRGYHANENDQAEHGEDDPDQRVVVLRRDRIGTSLLLVLFAGSPGCVHLREPGVGLRFGFDLASDAATMVFNEDAENHVQNIGTKFERGARTGPASWVGGDRTSFDVAQALLQNPFVAVFHESLAEKYGSEVAPEDGQIPMVRKVRVALPAARQHGRG